MNGTSAEGFCGPWTRNKRNNRPAMVASLKAVPKIRAVFAAQMWKWPRKAITLLFLLTRLFPLYIYPTSPRLSVLLCQPPGQERRARRSVRAFKGRRNRQRGNPVSGRQTSICAFSTAKAKHMDAEAHTIKTGATMAVTLAHIRPASCDKRLLPCRLIVLMKDSTPNFIELGTIPFLLFLFARGLPITKFAGRHSCILTKPLDKTGDTIVANFVDNFADSQICIDQQSLSVFNTNACNIINGGYSFFLFK